MNKQIGQVVVMVIVLMAGTAVLARSAEVTIPNTFEANSPAKAEEVNGNFGAVKTAVDDNNSRVGALESAQASLQAKVDNLTTINWQEVPGTSVQAEPNNGYIANNQDQVTISLPVSPAIGDIVEIVGSGAGGWKIAQNDGQSILAMAAQRAWVDRNMSGNWYGMASSADGNKLLAANYGEYLYRSTDGGTNWSAIPGLSGLWVGAASSADGSKLVAVQYGGLIYSSMNSGVTWSATSAPGGLSWRSVASSSDGNKLVAAAYNNRLYTSVDSGATWSANLSAPMATWYSVASSSDGSRLVAAAYNSRLYTSVDSGVTWSVNLSAPIALWGYVASSADGTTLVATTTYGQIYTSADSGVSWALQQFSGSYSSVAISADGSTILANLGTNCYLSSDAGVTWELQGMLTPTNTSAASVVSADANVQVTTFSGGKIYTRRRGTTSGVTGTLTGAQWDTVRLQYIGSGTFLIRDYEGDLVFY